jgi:hypothetical protein
MEASPFAGLSHLVSVPKLPSGTSKIHFFYALGTPSTVPSKEVAEFHRRNCCSLWTNGSREHAVDPELGKARAGGPQARKEIDDRVLSLTLIRLQLRRRAANREAWPPEGRSAIAAEEGSQKRVIRTPTRSSTSPFGKCQVASTSIIVPMAPVS